MGNVMNLLKIFSLIVSSSAFIVKLYEFTNINTPFNDK